jgi:DNA-binding SARP family transcriptional activator
MALSTGARDRKTLAAMLWPDLDEASAQNAVRVLMSRLRSKLGRPDLVRTTLAGYELAERPDLDLFLLERALATRRVAAIAPDLRDRLGRNYERLPQWMLVKDWLAPYVRRYERAIDRVRAALARDARSGGRLEEAAHWDALSTLEDADERRA